jgi:hypothetical protein
MLRRLLIVPVVALILAGFAGLGHAQFGSNIRCYGAIIPVGYHKVPNSDFYSFLCTGRPGFNNAFLIAPD